MHVIIIYIYTYLYKYIYIKKLLHIYLINNGQFLIQIKFNFFYYLQKQMCFKALTSEEEATNPSLNITHCSPKTYSNPITQLEPRQSAFSFIKAPSKEASTSSTLSKDSSTLLQTKSPFTQHLPSSNTKTPVNMNKSKNHFA